MPNKDNSLKQFLELNTIFADVANNGLYLIRLHLWEEGYLKEKPEYEAIIAPEELMDANTKDYYNIEGESHHLDRDVAKFWEKGGCTIVLVGVENQTSMDPNMVIRSMVYDAVGYNRELRNEMDLVRTLNREKAKNQSEEKQQELEGRIERAKKLYPVLTFVYYYGSEEHHFWHGAKTLKERLASDTGVHKTVLEAVNDYRLPLIEIWKLTDEQLLNFKSDFGLVIRAWRGKTDLDRDGDDTLVDKWEALQALSALLDNAVFDLGSPWMREITKKEDVHMREVMDVYGRAVREETEKKTRKETRKQDYQEIARKLAAKGLPEDDIRSVCSEVLSEEEITEALASVKVPG